MTYYLALDWGGKKIGVALADEETRIAFAHTTLTADMGLFEILRNLIDEYNVEKIILGITTHSKQNDNQKNTKQFKDAIEDQCDVDVVLADEMFSSKMAQDNLKQAEKKDISNDDAEAARIILQSWLDQS